MKYPIEFNKGRKNAENPHAPYMMISRKRGISVFEIGLPQYPSRNKKNSYQTVRTDITITTNDTLVNTIINTPRGDPFLVKLVHFEHWIQASSNNMYPIVFAIASNREKFNPKRYISIQSSPCSPRSDTNISWYKFLLKNEVKVVKRIPMVKNTENREK